MKLDKNDPALLRLADSPFLPILRERIATRAYFHGVSRTGQDWQRPESNWLQAEREEIALVASYLGCFPLGPGGFANARPLDFERNYARAAHFRHYFGATNARPVVHGPAIPRVCALCQTGTSAESGTG